jgi:hypothetical protein
MMYREMTAVCAENQAGLNGVIRGLIHSSYRRDIYFKISYGFTVQA